MSPKPDTIQNLTSRTLLQCLELLPNLKECLLQEHLEGDISVDAEVKCEKSRRRTNVPKAGYCDIWLSALEKIMECGKDVARCDFGCFVQEHDFPTLHYFLQGT
jgi:hypothetical protein